MTGNYYLASHIHLRCTGVTNRHGNTDERYLNKEQKTNHVLKTSVVAAKRNFQRTKTAGYSHSVFLCFYNDPKILS